MTRRRGRSIAACVGLVVVVLAAVLLWSSRRQPPGVPPPASPEDPPIRAARPDPEPPPDGAIRGVCGFTYSGGPFQPGSPPPGRTSPRYGIPVEVRERDGDRKVAEAVSKDDGLFEVRVRPGTYRVVAVFWQADEFGRTTVERIVRVEPDQAVEVALFQGVIVP
jgi:hypothetical protein